VRQKHIITDKVNIIDTAPTLAGLMAIPVHYTWQGRAISEIFKTSVCEMVQPAFLHSEFDCRPYNPPEAGKQDLPWCYPI